VYASIASTYGLFGVSLGYFELWPSPNAGGTLASALMEAHEARASRWVAVPGDLIEVANNGGDPVCVASSRADQPDRVLLVDHGSPDHVDVLAVDFEQLLVLAGNVVAVRLALNGGELEDPRSALAENVAVLCDDEEIRSTWARLGRQAF